MERLEGLDEEFQEEETEKKRQKRQQLEQESKGHFLKLVFAV